jgi:hypothetical protein
VNARARLAKYVGALLLLAFAPDRAGAGPDLVYERGPGAESCPDESELTRAVQARLGEDRLAPGDGQGFRVEIQRGTDGFTARVTLIGAHESPWIRQFEGTDDCAELVQAIALAMSLAINPELALEPTVSPPPGEREPESTPPEPAPQTPAKEPPAPAEPARARRPAQGAIVRWGFGALVHGAFGAEPEPALGLTLLARARRAELSLGIEGRFERALDRELSSGGSVETSLLAAAVSPCFHFEWFAGCGVGLVGSLRASSVDVPDQRSDAGVYAAVGGRAGVEARLSPSVALVGRFDALVRVVPVEALRNGQVIWTAPPVSAALGLGALFEVP